MKDRETVIKGLNDICGFFVGRMGFEQARNFLRTIDDAVELLNEQDPVEPELEGGGTTWWYVCGECRGLIDTSDSFCRHCGRPLKKKSACASCAYKGSEDCALWKPGSENAFCPNGKLI